VNENRGDGLSNKTEKNVPSPRSKTSITIAKIQIILFDPDGMNFTSELCDCYLYFIHFKKLQE
jgi:hypothetical protein